MKITLKELAELTSSKYFGDENKILSGINILENASEFEISFFANPRYLDNFKKSNAGVICIDKNINIENFSNKNFLLCDDPSLTFQKIAEFFLNKNQKLSYFENISKSAVIHESAKIAKNVSIGPNTTIDGNVAIGENTFILGNVYIGQNVKIGSDCIIYPNTVIREDVIINNRVILQPGCVIGSCGFGYAFENFKYKKLNQIGNVILEDDVEIGANTTIDRARFKSTIIKKGTKIDNLVQIAHNVEIGENTAIAALSGIAGSTKIGNYCVMGGQVGITGHIEIEDKVMLATRSGVSKSLKEGKYRGSPAVLINEYNKQYVFIKNLNKTIEALNKKIEILENKLIEQMT